MVTRKTNNGSVKCSLRLGSKVTSVTLKKDIVLLWYMYSEKVQKAHRVDSVSIHKGIKKHGKRGYFENCVMPVLNEFISDKTDNWENDTGRGLSNYITKLMMREVMSSKMYKIFLKLR